MPTPIATDNQAGNFESRADLVKIIAREETPFLSDLGYERIYGRTHFWQNQPLASPVTTNQKVEGGTVTHAAGNMTARVEVSNTVENALNPFDITFDQDAVRKPQFGSGESSELNAQIDLKMKENKRDIDASCLSNNASVTPAQASSTAGVSRGAQAFITSNVIDGSIAKYADGVLTQDMFDEGGRKAYRQGGKPTDAYCGSFQASRISRFVRNLTRNISESGRTLVDVVDTYQNGTGIQEIHIEPQMDILFDTLLLLIQKDMWKIGWLRPPSATKEGIVGTSQRGFVDATFTLICYAQAANTKFINLRSES